MKTKSLLPLLAASFVLALPATSLADRRVFYHGGHHYSGRCYSSHYHHGYRTRPYGYYGHGHGYRYRSYPRVAVGFSIFSRPTYTARPVYRGQVVSNRLAVDVQRALKRRGYYYGAIDGDIGSGSRAAIRAYQRDHGLAITGRIDSALVRALRI
jgi:hypothetical protein